MSYIIFTNMSNTNRATCRAFWWGSCCPFFHFVCMFCILLFVFRNICLFAMAWRLEFEYPFDFAPFSFKCCSFYTISNQWLLKDFYSIIVKSSYISVIDVYPTLSFIFNNTCSIKNVFFCRIIDKITTEQNIFWITFIVQYLNIHIFYSG